MIQVQLPILNRSMFERKQSNHFDISHIGVSATRNLIKRNLSPASISKVESCTENAVEPDCPVAAKKSCGFLREVTNYHNSTSSNNLALNSLEVKTGRCCLRKAKLKIMKSRTVLGVSNRTRTREEIVNFVCDKDSSDLVRDKILLNGGTIDDVDMFNKRFNARYDVEFRNFPNESENRGYYVSDSYKLYSSPQIQLAPKEVKCNEQIVTEFTDVNNNGAINTEVGAIFPKLDLPDRLTYKQMNLVTLYPNARNDPRLGQKSI